MLAAISKQRICSFAADSFVAKVLVTSYSNITFSYNCFRSKFIYAVVAITYVNN